MKLVSKSLADQVYDLVKEQILSGKIPCGSKISEDSLATQFGVSRTPIREALKRLSAYGIIQMEPRSHSSVISLSEKESQDIATFRIYLEDYAIDHIDPKRFNDNLETICRHASDCQYALGVGNRAKAFELDSLFHISLIRTCDNSALIDVYERLDAKIQLLRIAQNAPNEALLGYLMQHMALVELIKNSKTEEAKKLMYNHILHEEDQEVKS